MTINEIFYILLLLTIGGIVCIKQINILTASLLLLCPTVFASDEVAQTNVFNADLSHPTITTAVTEFEKVCLPFIANETELTPLQNRDVFKSRMLEAGYSFEKEVKSKQDIPLTAFNHVASDYWASACQDYKIKKIRTETKKISKEDTLKLTSQTGEIGGYSVTPVYSQQLIRQIYTNRASANTSAYLTWRDKARQPKVNDYPFLSCRFEKEPYDFTSSLAKSCRVHMHTADISPYTLTEKIISRDPDWIKIGGKEDLNYWRQCSPQFDQYFIYSVSLVKSSLEVKVSTLQDKHTAEMYGCFENDK